MNKKDFEKFEKLMKDEIENCELSIKHVKGKTSLKVLGSNHAVEFLLLELFDKLSTSIPKKYYEEIKGVVSDYFKIF